MATLISDDEEDLSNLSNNSDFIQEQIDKMDKFENSNHKGIKSKNKKKKKSENKNIESKIEINSEHINKNKIENKNKDLENEENNKNKCCECIII